MKNYHSNYSYNFICLSSVTILQFCINIVIQFSSTHNKDINGLLMHFDVRYWYITRKYIPATGRALRCMTSDGDLDSVFNPLSTFDACVLTSEKKHSKTK